MNNPRSQEEELFDAAQRLTDPDQRKAFLDAACAKDQALRRRLDELFGAQRQAEQFFKEGVEEFLPATSDTATHLAMPLSEKAGDLIGRYKLLEKVGEGGFGAVYVAEQREPIKRRVALKIIKLGMDTRQVVGRFEAERQALAMMDHPNIAKVLDAGATETGRPYFVMELVRGIPITQYCDENHLSTDARLELFILVCQAIQHAHQKGIIHRDIKPSNILLTVNDGVPVPKVIDFGIAKATQGELTDKTIYTQFQQFIGTPAYMSPEQADMTSLDIDTRSDIYALGVLLYELLVGKTPFDGKELLLSGLDEMRRTIREKEPLSPSTRLGSMIGEELTTTAKHRGTDAPKLINVLRGDMDWVVMKCLEKDRTRRYETANGLAMDINRFMGNEPVLARPPTMIYRFQKWTRRNKLVFGAAAAVTGALVLGVVVSSFQAVKATQARRSALEAQANAVVQRGIAEKNARAAKENEQRAIASQAQMRRTVYATEMYFAAQALENANLREARTLLSHWGPATNSAGPEDPRDFTWRLLKHQSRGDQTFALTTKGRPLTDLRLSPDGRCLAIESTEKQWQTDFWDFESRQLMVTLTNASIWGWNDSNHLALIATSQGELRWYDPWTRRHQHILDIGLVDPSVRVTVSYPFISVSTTSDQIKYEKRIFDLETGQKLPGEVRYPPVPKEYEAALAQLKAEDERWVWRPALFGSGFHPGKRWAAFVHTKSFQIALWDREKRSFARKLKFLRSLSFALQESSTLLATTPANSREEPITIYDLSSDREPVRLPSIDPRSTTAVIDLSPNGRFLASAGSDGVIRLWDPATGRLVRSLRGHEGRIGYCAFSPNSRWLVSGDESGRVLIWRMDASTAARDEVAGVQGVSVLVGQFHGQAVFSLDGKRIAAELSSDETAVWDVASLREMARFPGRGQVLGFTQDGTALDVLHTNHVARWDIESHNSRVLLHESDGLGVLKTNEFPFPANSLGATSSDGRRFVELNVMGTLRVWDLPSRRMLHEEKAHSLSVLKSMALSKDIFATGDVLTREIRLWNTATGRPERQFNAAFGGGMADGVAGLAFSPDGHFLACGAGRGLVKIFDVNHDEPRFVLTGHRQTAHTVAFSPDGKTLASAGSDGTIRFWSVTDGKQLAAIPFSDVREREPDADDTVSWLSFAPDGSCLAALSKDGRLRLFRAESLNEIDAVETNERVAQLH